MTPDEFDLVVRRMISIGTPKETWNTLTTFVRCELPPRCWMWSSKKKRYHAAQDFVFIVLMCSWLSCVKLQPVGDWTILDLFCGQANLSKLASNLAFNTWSFDLKFGSTEPSKGGRKFRGKKRNPMDINGHCGFVFLSEWKTTTTFFLWGFCYQQVKYEMFTDRKNQSQWVIMSHNELAIFLLASDSHKRHL